VTLVQDAVRSLHEGEAAAMMRELEARGGSLSRAADICAA